MFNSIKLAASFAKRNDSILKEFHKAIDSLSTVNSQIEEHHARHTDKISELEQKIEEAKAEQKALLSIKTANETRIGNLKSLIV